MRLETVLAIYVSYGLKDRGAEHDKCLEPILEGQTPLSDAMRALRDGGYTFDEAIELLERCDAEMGKRRPPAPQPRYQRPELKPASVYVFEDAGFGVKVGVSQHPDYRCSTLEKERGRSLSIRYTTDTFERPAAFSVERRAHEILSDYRLEGEWFSCSAQDAVNAIAAAVDEVAR
jgi:hypothetical protein